MIVPKYSQFYKAIVATIITDNNNEATMELRIKIPSIHYGLKEKDLPIAKPLSIPGVAIDKQMFINQIQSNPHVYVMFESGDLNKPLYIVSSEATFSKAVSAIGPAGVSPHIGSNGNWFVGEVDTGVKAQGPQGYDGLPGVSPHIGPNGNWFVGEVDTGVKAQGPQGKPGEDSTYVGPNFIGVYDLLKETSGHKIIVDGVHIELGYTIVDIYTEEIYKVISDNAYSKIGTLKHNDVFSIKYGYNNKGKMFQYKGAEEQKILIVKDSEEPIWNR